MCCKPIEGCVVVADDNGVEAPFLVHVGVEDRQRPVLLQALEVWTLPIAHCDPARSFAYSWHINSRVPANMQRMRFARYADSTTIWSNFDFPFGNALENKLPNIEIIVADISKFEVAPRNTMGDVPLE
ncbi:hypothetical protein ZEAMMB73_Zm00001d002497 [Zea mays]|uniref:Uncharacterized protein n=1 Tax=Zea mays TaxID=4577 RepID=A0A1D6E1J7_MAIZE|nr:hypothetical protein ZEAMMB73_Zm00001d002497 [Zea mays]